MFNRHLALCASLVALCMGASTVYKYSKTQDWRGSNFFDQFNFYTGDDYTHGYVDYINRTYAASLGLISTKGDTVYMSADSTNVATGRGRMSQRLGSKLAFTKGLFVIDLSHMPVGCATWPAFWTVGPNWPAGGEIDILEGVDNNTRNQGTLHTSPGCTMDHVSTSSYTGNMVFSDCSTSTSGSGCGIQDAEGSYGNPFNKNGGGVIATVWDDSKIEMFFWRHGSVPSDLVADMPDPSTWGKPFSRFDFGKYCSSDHFYSHWIIFDLTFCGDWAGATFAGNCQASTGYSSCSSYVQNNPAAFKEAYWLINYVKVFELAQAAPVTGTSFLEIKPSLGVLNAHVDLTASLTAAEFTSVYPQATTNTGNRSLHWPSATVAADGAITVSGSETAIISWDFETNSFDHTFGYDALDASAKTVFTIEAASAGAFLSSELALLGLGVRERSELIASSLAEMQQYRYVRLSFLTQSELCSAHPLSASSYIQLTPHLKYPLSVVSKRVFFVWNGTNTLAASEKVATQASLPANWEAFPAFPADITLLNYGSAFISEIVVVNNSGSTCADTTCTARALTKNCPATQVAEYPLPAFSKWGSWLDIYNWPYGAAKFIPNDANNSLYINVTNGGANIYAVIFWATMPTTMNVGQDVYFTARAECVRDIEIQFRMGASPYSQIGIAQAFNLNTQFQQYHLRGSAYTNYANSQLIFFVGAPDIGTACPVEVKDIRLTRSTCDLNTTELTWNAWTLYQSNPNTGAKASLDASSTSDVASVTVSKIDGTVWDIQFETMVNIEVVSGQLYTLVFDVSSDALGQIQGGVCLNSGDYHCASTPLIATTTSWSTVSTILKPNFSTSSGRVSFNLGYVPGVYHFRNIKLNTGSC